MSVDAGTHVLKPGKTPARTTSTSDNPEEFRRRPMHAWKLVLAADEPWRGSVYRTRAGRRRESFDSPEEFMRAVMRLTGWEFPPPSTSRRDVS